MTHKANRVKVIGVIILLFFLSLKVYYVASAYNHQAYSSDVLENNGDATHYLLIAKNIYEHKTYSDNNSDIPSQTATWRSPIWPLVLSAFYCVTSNPLGLIICKSILEFLLLVLSFIILRKNGKLHGYFLLPFLLLIIEPQYLKYSITFLSESLSAVLMLLLVLVFSFSTKNKKLNILIPLLSAIVILCHPVSVFFVTSLVGFYVLFNIKKGFKIVVFHSILFLGILIIWPIRNQMVFNEGLYLTASQGATFSKGWNETVTDEFTNVDGDLADEYLNLKYLDQEALQSLHKTDLQNSKLLKKATLKFIGQSSFMEILQIAVKKLKSNFNPFPEKSKPGFLENLGVFFRCLYLLLFLNLFYRLITKPKFNFNKMSDRVYLIIFSIFVGQTLMSIYIYTGLRFNSIYGLSLLFCFLYLITDSINDYLLRQSVPLKPAK